MVCGFYRNTEVMNLKTCCTKEKRKLDVSKKMSQKCSSLSRKNLSDADSSQRVMFFLSKNLPQCNIFLSVSRPHDFSNCISINMLELNSYLWQIMQT